MYKVILVDDEIWSLEGLAASFDWEDHGFQVLGKYTESLEAICRIKEDPPDVVFTDIRMPDMTGLEMMKEVRESGQNVEFIIVSGYAEFEYAREAVRQGAFDYNLKPIDMEDGDKLLKRLRQHLNRKRYIRDEWILQRMLYENAADACLLPLYSRQTIQVMAIVGADSDIDFGILWKPLAAAGCCYVKLMTAEHKRIVCFDAERDDVLKPWMESVEREIGSRAYIGISPADNSRNLGILLKEAILASSGRFIGKGTGITRYEEVVNPYYETYGKRMCASIVGNKYEEACNILDEIGGLVREENLGIYYIARLWNQIAILLQENSSDGRRLRIEYLDFFHLTKRFESLDELCQYIKIEIAEILLNQKERMEAKKSYNENFMKLLKYVEENYNKKLSLSALAERFFLNMSYCSELFKKVTGQNFSDYVTRIRMEKAAKLLSEGNYRIKEVAEMTGYSDAFYFSKVMKKYYGVAPAHFLSRTSKEV